ncbi:RNA-directed DNA polymerase, eukaryota [Tanacetum coccineum]
MHLHTNVARFDRPPIHSSRPNISTRPAANGASSFASVLKDWVGWGELIILKLTRKDCFARKRICIKTKLEDNILEKFKIIVRGKNFVIRAKELFVWSLTFNDNKEVDDYSEDDSVNGAEEINGDISKQMNLDDESDIEGVSDTVFDDKADSLGHEHTQNLIPFLPGFTPEREFQHVDAQEVQGMENSLSKRRSEGLSSRVLEDAQPLNEHVSPSIDSKKKQKTKLDLYFCMDVKVLWGNYKFEYTISEAVGNSGGILCVWDPSVFRKEHHVVSDNFVALYGSWVSNQAKLLVVSIYAPQSITSKRSLWSYISSLISRWDGHCMVMGDFNEVRCMEDRLGSVYNAQGANEFNSFISNSGLVEIQLEGGRKVLFFDAVRFIKKKIHDIKSSDARDYMQKAKIQWAIEGDENSIFFHGIINHKRANLAIKGVMVDGEWVDDPCRVKEEFRLHFANRVRSPPEDESANAVWVLCEEINLLSCGPDEQKKTTSHGCLKKLICAKAYDSIRWDFYKMCFRAFGSVLNGARGFGVVYTLDGLSESVPLIYADVKTLTTYAGFSTITALSFTSDPELQVNITPRGAPYATIKLQRRVATELESSMDFIQSSIAAQNTDNIVLYQWGYSGWSDYYTFEVVYYILDARSTSVEGELTCAWTRIGDIEIDRTTGVCTVHISILTQLGSMGMINGDVDCRVFGYGDTSSNDKESPAHLALHRYRQPPTQAQPVSTIGQPTAPAGSTGPTVTSDQATTLPHAFTAGTLHDPATGAWNMNTGLESVRYGVSNVLDTAYWGFLGVGTTHGYAVSSLMDTAYCHDGYSITGLARIHISTTRAKE